MGTRHARILSLDGGGIRGVYTAAFLAHVEQYLQIRLVEHLELVTGTSTGAIIGLALASGMTARETLDAYKQAGPLLFGKGRGWFGRLFSTAHDNAPLRQWLQDTFKDKALNDSRVSVAIPTFAAATASPRVWKSDHHDELHSGGNKKMWEVALASAAAPTYLPATQIDGLGAYLDGGLWANNPSLVGLIEARRYCGFDFQDIWLVSVGTGHRTMWHQYDDIRTRGKLRWAKGVIDIQLAAQSAAAHEQTRLLLGKEHYLRVDTDLAIPIELDDVRQIPLLENLGREAGMQHLQEMKRMLHL